MSEQDIRWIQRFSNFRKALEKLRDAIAGYEDEDEANEIASKIAEEYYDLLLQLKKRLDQELTKE